MTSQPATLTARSIGATTAAGSAAASYPGVPQASGRRISGFTATGRLHLGNYLGAIRPMVDAQQRARSHGGPGGDAVIFVADLHGLTVEHDPTELRATTLEIATLLLAAGIDPGYTTCYVQSHLPEHMELHYLLESATGYGEARRMIQFREKAATQEHVRLSLLTYPVLMAADILLHDADRVPVGADQAQHVELTRDVAVRFNSRYGPTFVVPRVVNPPVAARVMDLADPRAKMNKSARTGAGTLRLLDPPDLLRRKIMRAVTDTGESVGTDAATQPGVVNLLEILAACTGTDPATLAGGFTGYGALKAAVADAVIATLDPVRTRYQALASDPGYVSAALAGGAARARERAARTVRRARDAIGLLPGTPPAG